MSELVKYEGLMDGKVVIFNAPPACGKDYAVEKLIEATGCSHIEFKMALHRIAIAMTGLSKERYFEIYNDRMKKEEPQEEFLWQSPRSLLIMISEDIMKPRFGEQYFGLASAQMLDLEKGSAFSDGGFPEEVFPLADRVGAENIFVVRFNRNGKGFGSDSRNYLQPSQCPQGVRFIDLRNDGDIHDFVNSVTDYIEGCTVSPETTNPMLF